MYGTVGSDVTPDVVRIEIVRTHADRFRTTASQLAVVLRHDVFADHASRFADVELVRPMIVVREFVFGESPFTHRLANVFRHAGIVGDEVEPTGLVIVVFLDDFLSSLVRRFGIIVIHADEIGAERSVIIGVGLEVRNRIELVERPSPTGFIHAAKQFVIFRVVIVRFGKRNAVFRIARQTHAETIRLHTMIRLTANAGLAVVDVFEPSAAWITRLPSSEVELG